MSKLIPDNNTLLHFVPNVLKSVQGELALFEKIQSHLEVAEDWLAAKFLSAPMLEMLSALRQAHLFGAWDATASAPYYRRAWQHIFAIELFMLRENECPVPSCIEVVNALRNAPDGVFEEWKQSPVARLFENHGFQNKRGSGGYWF